MEFFGKIFHKMLKPEKISLPADLRYDFSSFRELLPYIIIITKIIINLRKHAYIETI